MINAVVVPLDGSRFAEAVIPTARWLAQSARSGLHFVHVRPATEESRVVASYLTDAARAVNTPEEPPTEVELKEGEVLELLPGAVSSPPDRLVVMATHGRGEPGPMARGSVAERLVERATAPILLVKPCQGSALPGKAIELKRILAAVDLTRDPAPFLRGLVEFASLAEAHVTLLTVIPPASDDAGVMTARCRAAQLQLDGLTDRLRLSGIRAAARVAVGYPVADTILAELARCPTDLVVLHPRAVVEQGNGRTTDAVIRGATKPILIVPASATPPRPAGQD